MVNEQGGSEGDVQLDMVGSNIGLIRYFDSVDVVYNPHYRQTMETTITQIHGKSNTRYMTLKRDARNKFIQL